MQLPFLFGSLADDLRVGDPALNRMLVSVFFVATALGSLGLDRRNRIAPRVVLSWAPMVAAASMGLLVLQPGPAVTASLLAAGGLMNGLVTRSALRVVNGGPPGDVPARLAWLTVASVSAPVFVGLTIGLSGFVGLSPSKTAGVQAALAAGLGALTLRAHRHLPRPSAVAVSTARGLVSASARLSRGWTVITVCAFAAALTSNIVAVFFVPLARDAGFGPGAAGTALLLTSVLAATIRLWMSRHPQMIEARTRHTSTLILVGAVGTVLLAIAPGPVTGLALFLIGFGSWGWIGLLIVASRVARDPVATGVAIQGSNFAAAAAGPLLAGVVTGLVGSSALLLILTVMASASAFVLWRPLARLDATVRCHARPVA